jgi:predicted DNA-binding transcriptional regulator
MEGYSEHESRQYSVLKRQGSVNYLLIVYVFWLAESRHQHIVNQL